MGGIDQDATGEAAETGAVLWRPPADVADRTRVGDYLRWLREHRGRDFAGYADLYDWSVTDLAGFWSSVWEYFDLTPGVPAGPALTEDRMPGARWFPQARLNYAQRVLAMPGLADDDLAVLGRSQSRGPVELTAAQLRDQVARARAGLVRLGVGRGDRVAAYLPNVPETVVLLLATASLGAVFSSCAPEFGTRSVCDRWQQIEPTVLVAVDGYQYGRKAIDRTAEVAAIRDALPSVRHTVVLSYLDGVAAVPDALSWQEFTAEAGPLEFEQVGFDHPLYVLYSSGTTGLPKPIVHGHGGILLEHVKSHALHADLGPGDRFFWFSTTGWMMWNYLVSAPAVGAAIVLYDGNPGYPDLGALWQLAAETGVTYFGTSAPFLLSCRKAELVPNQLAELSRIRGVGSTGAPLPPEGFRWVYENVGADVLLSSFSGGTDVCTGFVGGSPLLPVYEGEISGRCLGCAVESFDANGTPQRDRLGELVITRPMPSMPVGFWGDTDGSRYADAYFSVFPGVWRHGDWITITSRGTCLITGRSDATLNRGGVRLGTAEFYSVVEGLPQVEDSVVVHLEDDEGGAGELLLFVVPAAGVDLDDELRRTINTALRSNLSPRHVPDAIYQVPAVPHTLSAKKLEVPVKRILTGTPADSAAAKGALANPESLSAFEQLARDRQG
ncbi:acetoacetyl-CoA synthetase [Actinocatenispora thailandica]|uniref:Acetoacetyl-CoA synthetase n=1 Tax=Actinocatenispora thailandica TaxID=227318 RepID=A0A7R7HZF8_9ACTN|nr:acetoacetate--CoA ligase [Actinocatenispora thailandica]BCJ37461.1 acetoacetyl-CoA synthetase [Actinocatenispora thailandica]